MIIWNYLYNLMDKMFDDSLPIELRSAVAVFIVCTITTMCFFNILFYFTVLLVAENKYVLEKMEKWWLLRKIINLYKNTSKLFIVFEVCIFSSLNLTLLYNCYKIIKHLLDQ